MSLVRTLEFTSRNSRVSSSQKFKKLTANYKESLVFSFRLNYLIYMNIVYALGMSDNSTIREDEVIQFPVAYHVVVASHKRESLFTHKKNCNNLAYLLFEATVLHDYSLYAFCIMPDHAHILFRPGDIGVKHFVDLIKLRFDFMYAKAFEKKLKTQDRSMSIWQEAFRQDVINNTQIIATALHILDNPVRNGIVSSSIDYPFSFVCGGKQYRP
jgi:REP element-mobilizing transposase RayT